MVFFHRKIVAFHKPILVVSVYASGLCNVSKKRFSPFLLCHIRFQLSHKLYCIIQAAPRNVFQLCSDIIFYELFNIFGRKNFKTRDTSKIYWRYTTKLKITHFTKAFWIRCAKARFSSILRAFTRTKCMVLWYRLRKNSNSGCIIMRTITYDRGVND